MPLRARQGEKSNRRATQSRSRFTIAFAIAAGCICLTACDPIYDPNAPLAVRESGGHIELSTCAELDLAKVLIATRSSQTDNEWVELLYLEGEARVGSAQVISRDSIPNGLEVTALNDGGLVPGAEVSIFLAYADGSEFETSVSVTVPSAGIPAGNWLLPDSTVSETPCP
jgi:hypothetical protein